MREKILSHSTVVENLAPFIVTYWNGAHDSQMPTDVSGIFRQAPRRVKEENNIICFVLNPAGEVLRSFNAFRGKTPVGRGSSMDRLADQFRRELEGAVRGLRFAAPQAKKRVVLPDTKSGVRLFVLSHDRRGQLDRDPIVETEPMTAQQWGKFSYRQADQKTDATVITNWLSHIYPSAQQGVPPLLKIQSVRGSLRWQKAGADQNSRYALLRGTFQLVGDGKTDGRSTRSKYRLTGRFEAVLTYDLDSPEVRSIRAVVEGSYPLVDAGIDGQREIVAVIESRPQ